MFSWQNVKLTETACVHLPATLRDQLIFTYSSHHHRTDPRVFDVLLRHWRHASLYYPPHHHHHQQHDNNDDSSVISLRELSLSVALAFISAVKLTTLQSLNTLHLTAFYTGQSIDHCFHWISRPI